MLSSIAAITIPLLLLMFIVFFLFEHNRKKKIAQKKLAFNETINDFKLNYKLDVETLCEEVKLKNSTRDKLYIVANNFFVYQPINEDNIGLFEVSLKKLSQSYNALLTHFRIHDDVELAQERIELFVESLPSQSRGYNNNFYQSELMLLNQLLEIPEQDEEELTNIDEASSNEAVYDEVDVNLPSDDTSPDIEKSL